MKLFFPIAVCASLFCVPLVHAYSNFADYHYQVDYFEVVGNQPGDLRDEFDDGDVDPWYIEEHTVTESGGYQHLQTPGVVTGPFEFDGVSWIAERANSRTDDAPGTGFDVAGGAGSFTATSRWLSAAAGQNEFYGMALSSWTGGSEVDVNLNMYNLDPVYADAIGIPSGLGIWYLYDDGGLNFQTVSIDPSEITGDVLFRLTFDDAADMISGSYSLDGGDTFESPFSAFAFDLEVGDMDWALEAEEWTIPEPATMSLLALGGLVMIRKRKLSDTKFANNLLT